MQTATLHMARIEINAMVFYKFSGVPVMSIM